MDEPVNEEQGPRSPSNNDYMAGAMLANGVIWVWMQAVSLFRVQLSRVPTAVLADITYVIYVFGGYEASALVCMRADEKMLNHAMQTMLYAWVMSLLIMYTSAAEPSMRVSFSLFLCLAAGGVLGGYMAIRKRLAERRKDLSATS